MDKVIAAKEFLKGLENPLTTQNLMFDRIDVQMLCVIDNHAELIAKVKDRSKLELKDLVAVSMILGFLLKTHLDRYELAECLKHSIED